MILIREEISFCEAFAREFPVTTFLVILAAVAFVVATVALGIKVHKRRVTAGKEALIGHSGKAITDFEPGMPGKAFLMGEIWDAVSNEKIRSGEKILVTNIEEFTLRITRKT
ncbi:MAG: NfeD family protein [Chloroflexota bacterium]